MLNCPLRRILLCTFTGVALLLAATRPATAGEESQFRWVNDPEQGTADLLLGDEPVVRYMYAYDTSDEQRREETYKVYHHVFGPGTGELITKGPGGLYSHHRGLYVGWNRTRVNDESYDFWHSRNGAHQRHAEFTEKKADAQQGTMTSEIHWNDADGEPVITESRTITASKFDTDTGPGYGWQIDWRTVLSSNRGEIQLDGDRQHAGFQFRAAQEVAETGGARFIRPAGFPQQPEAVQVGDKGDPPPHIDLGWFAMTYELAGTRYTVEYHEDPSLPKPSLFSERPYGRFGAFFRATLTEDEPLTMRYRVVVTTGEAPARDTIQKRYDAFVAELESAEK